MFSEYRFVEVSNSMTFRPPQIHSLFFPASDFEKISKFSKPNHFYVVSNRVEVKRIFRFSRNMDDEKSAAGQYFLRPGGIARCRSNGKWSYAVLIGRDDVVSVEKDGALKEYSLQEFLDDHGAEQLQVAFQDRISVGAYDVAHCARMESYDEEQYSNTKSFVLHCLGQDDCGSVNAAIEERFGAFEWIQYEIPVNESETEEEEEEEVLPRKKAPLRLRTVKEEEEEEEEES